MSDHIAEVIARAIHGQEDSTGFWSWEAFVPTASAALSALEKEGLVVVPRTPTDDMRVAALTTGLPGTGEPPLYEKVWNAMLSARPSWCRDE